MGFYSHKTFICPFFKQDAKLCIYCEGGKIKFPDRKAAVILRTGIAPATGGRAAQWPRRWNGITKGRAHEKRG